MIPPFFFFFFFFFFSEVAHWHQWIKPVKLHLSSDFESIERAYNRALHAKAILVEGVGSRRLFAKAVASPLAEACQRGMS